MAIELKQSLRLTQQLLITPQLQQAIKLLQLSRAELIETVQKELIENPVLEDEQTTVTVQDAGAVKADSTERLSDLKTATADGSVAEGPSTDIPPGAKEEFNWGNYVETYFGHGAREPRSFSGLEEQPNYENLACVGTSLHDHLEWQVRMGDYSKSEEEASLEIIGNLDENGYLQANLEELKEKTLFSLDELDDALFIVQQLDPPGVGARDLKECLTLQVKELGQDKEVLVNIITNYLPFIEKRDFVGLGKKLGLAPKRAGELAQIIYSLEPKPGRAFNSGEVVYITPDVYIRKVGQEFVVILNEDGMPKLQISNFYKSAIMKEINSRAHPQEKQSSLDMEAQGYIQEKLKSALWLIKSIHQRQKTLYKVTKCIAEFQHCFLEQGVQQLKPLVLKDVADRIGVHESTVSRATNGKYVHTPQGVFELKYFFNTGLANVAGGEDFANEAVKQMIKSFVDSENRKQPLSDQALTSMLKTQNIDIARRTVAKYREVMGILSSSRRKRAF